MSIRFPAMISPVIAPVTTPGVSSATKAGGQTFADLLSNATSEVQSRQQQAGESIDSFLRGENTDVHQVAMDMQKADLSFELMLEVRNKVVQAYQEIMRSQI
jgi:flagellar hook-basal body complex protein FliE